MIFLMFLRVLLLLPHIFMGVTLVILSKNKLRSQIEERMLDVTNTAASQLNGDELETFEMPSDEEMEKVTPVIISRLEHQHDGCGCGCESCSGHCGE